MTGGRALTSAADSRLVFNRRRPNPIDVTNCDNTENGFLMSGPDCRMLLRRSRIAFRRRSSRDVAYVDGRVRDLQTAPSSLSNSSCCEDIPTNPPSRPSSGIASTRELNRGRANVLAGCPVQAHCRGPHVGVAEECRKVGPQVSLFECGYVFPGIAP